ncbi:MAG: hypothetical protein HC886_00805 [Leptolyngbyaceae cyanobacterium SM1_1_3]|nr:hypothetical protein [Leptolyngbyaceae cyanobacterium SM1_1_3]
MDEINLINDLISRDFDTLNPDQQRIRLLSNFHTEVANGGWKQYGERWRDEGGGMKAEEGRGMKAEG